MRLATLLLVLASATAADGPPFQAPLARLEPDGSRPVFINPPTFHWPRSAPGPYTLQLSRRADFSGAASATVPTDAFYRPLQPMEAGRWHWRVRAANGEWSPPAAFDLPADAVRWPIQSWESALAKVPTGHPRLWVRQEDLPALKAKSAGPLKDYLARWREEARRYLDEPLPLAQDKPRKKSQDFKENSVQRVSSKADAQRTMLPAGELAFLYLIDGDEAFAREAKRRALAAARLDPDGYTAHSVSDFANGAIIANVARVYDYLYPTLTPAERETLRGAIESRCRRAFAAYRPRLEERLFDAHGWQRVLMDATQGALAIYGESPEARDWLAWSLRMFVSTYPWWGGKDGGSAQGASYSVSSEMKECLEVRDLFVTATGLDLAVNPWYRANSLYHIYSHPPGGLQSRFGDTSASPAPPHPMQKLAALRRASLFNDPYAAAYAAAIPTGLPMGPDARLVALWGPFPKLPSRPLSELPPAHVFFDIGVAFLHSSLADPARDIFFEFKSSPYGSHNHAHADQNTFNIAVGSQPLIVDSGYYTAYGDAHHYGFTVRTKAHNGILVDGEGQAHRNLDAWGQITRFEQGAGFAYLRGSAPHAYHHVQLNRADRHVLWLAPGTFVIADDIEAEDGKPHRYDWLLHASREMRIDTEQRTVFAANDKGQARVTFLLPPDLRFRQTSKFDFPPEAWLRPSGEKFPDQWHFTATPSTSHAAERFVAVVQVIANPAENFPPLAALSANPVFRRAWKEWLPTAGLDWNTVAGAGR